jgi:hypothetical protein
MENGPGCQLRSDEWLKMLDQSRLRKEKRLVNKKTPEAKAKKKTEGMLVNESIVVDR